MLVVDDNVDIRLLVRMQVEHLDGIDGVDEAANGVEAVELAGRAQPDIVLLDLDMPVMSGDVALPLLRTLAPRAVIAIHSATPADGAPRAGLEHADAYLQKCRDDVGEYVAELVRSRARA